MPRKRLKLLKSWLENDGCFYCEEPMRVAMTLDNLLECLQKLTPEQLKQRVALEKLPKKGSEAYPEDSATIEHLRSKFDPKRQEPVKNGEQRIAIACSKCNHEKGKEEEAEQQIELLREKSKQHKTPRTDPWELS